MPAYLDETPLSAETSEYAGLLAHAKEQAGKRGRVLIEAMLNGQPATEELWQSAGNLPEHSRLQFLSAEPRALVAETLLDVADHLGESKAYQQRASEMIQQGRIAEAMDQLQVSLKAWETVRQAVSDGCELLGLDISTTSVVSPSGETLNIGTCTDKLALELGAIKRHFSAQDWAGLSDSLGYDLQGQADVWGQMLRGLAKVARSQPVTA